VDRPEPVEKPRLKVAMTKPNATALSFGETTSAIDAVMTPVDLC
jgi:hypothetical protein